MSTLTAQISGSRLFLVPEFLVAAPLVAGVANAEQWMGITEEEPPISSYAAHEYTEAGLPWFDYYDGDKVAIDGAKRLGTIKSVKNIKPKYGENFWVDDLPITNPKVVQINKREVNAGEW